MNIYALEGDKVIFTGATDAQVMWGGCDDPRPILVIGNQYIVEKTEVHSEHTKVTLKGFTGRFNSVHFDDV